MPLPSPELLGLTDPREVSGSAAVQAAPASVGPPAPPSVAPPARTRTASASARPRPLRAPSPRPAATPAPSQRPAATPAPTHRPAPEERTFVQIMVAPEVRERLADASFALEDVRPGWHLQQTIVGALIARHVAPEDPRAMDALLERLAAWTEDPLSRRRGEALKLGWRLPHSLTRRLDKAVLRLRASHRHLAPSAKALIASLIVAELAADTPAELERLIALVGPYVDEYERPTPLAAVSG
jgi:hypothetical protein